MASTSYFILILVVSLTLSQFSFSSADDPTPSVHLINNMPPDHTPNVTDVTVTCKIQTGLPLLSVTVVLGQEFPFDAGITNDIYVCFARWGNFWAYFNAYDPLKEDKGRPIVYWSIRLEGFYKSWDKANWTGVTEWDN
ncbi:hypothetical protein RND71_008199 [Anisodus tanguticus]|uniref:S-protein homolog n=1 Tax=Anisodus tanguticus TaxID=243964 RepID=A0AAE1SNA1_9SOLA|nr:hypothetical protein RND71_008199 [Anisodus tanguticus]